MVDDDNLNKASVRRLHKELAAVKQRGLTILTEEDDTWPAPLREMPDAPLVLYVWGELTERDRHAVALVGSSPISATPPKNIRRMRRTGM